VTGFRDDFDRPDSGSTGNGWTDTSVGFGTIASGISGNRQFMTSNNNGQPITYRTDVAQNTGIIIRGEFSAAQLSDGYYKLGILSSNGYSTSGYALNFAGQTNSLQILDDSGILATTPFTFNNTDKFAFEWDITPAPQNWSYLWVWDATTGGEPTPATLSWTNSGSNFTPTTTGNRFYFTSGLQGLIQPTETLYTDYVEVQPLHQPPQIQTLTSSVNYTEGTAPVTLSPSAFAISPDGHPDLTKAVITIDPSTYQPGDELLVFDTTLGTASADGFYSGINVEYHFNPATGVLTLSGRDTNVDYSHVLDNIQFHSTSDNPDNAGLALSRTITWQLTDADVPFGPDFAAPVSYSAGTSPQAVLTSTTSADFNGDLILDLAVINAGSANVSILFGNGDGTFQPAANFAAGASPSSIGLGDFNSDFVDDLVVTNKTANTVSLLRGDGAGHFAAPTPTATGVAPTSAAVGDFNENGKLDIAVANAGIDPTTIPGTVWVMGGDGNGNFGVPLVLPVGLNPTFVTTAALHLTVSTHQDLVVANTGSNSISIFMGDGAGNFTPAAVPTVAVGTAPVAAVDARFKVADPGNDLAVVNSGSNNVTVLFGNNDGTFSGSVNVAVGAHPNSIAVGDFNGDHKIDFVTANGDGTVSLVYGNGDGTFQSALTYSAGTNAVSLAVADFSNDGNQDLAVADAGASAVAILLHNPTTESQLYTTNINVTAVNDAPANSVPGAQSTNEDTTLVFTGATVIQVSDVDGGTGNETVTLSVLHGTLTFGGSSAGLSSFTNGAASITLTGPTAGIDTALSSLSYAPAADYNGSDTLTVATNDNGHTGVDPSTLSLPNTGSATDERATSTVAIAINAVADTVTDNLTTPEDTPVTQNVLTGNDGVGADNFEDPGRQVTAVTQGAHGAVTFLANGSVTYTPNADYNGSDTFTYTVTSGGVTETGTVNVTINAVADTVADSLTTNEDTAVTANVLTGTNGASADNFEDAGRQVTAVTQGAHGSVTFAANGSVTYSPELNYNGGDTFTYTVTAGGVTETGSVSVTVHSVDDPPALDLDASAAGTGFTAAFAPGGAAVAVSDTDTTVSDPDNANMASAVITLTNKQVGDTLAIHGALPAGISAGIVSGASTITVTLSGSASAASYASAIHQVEFGNSGASPSAVDRDITVAVNDGQLDSNTAHATIHITSAGKAANDFNADGFSDIFWEIDSGALAIWEMNGVQIAFADYTRSGPSAVGRPGGDWHVVDTGDFDGDAHSDIFWRTDSGALAVWEMDGNKIKLADFLRNGSTPLGAPGPDWHALGALDADGDSKSDILWRTDSGALAIWEIDGTHLKVADYIRLGANAVGVPGPDWHIVGTGDLDGDGKGDILWQTDGGALALWRLDGTHIKSADFLRSGSSTVPVPGPDWHVVDVADFDGDGKSDILWRTGAAAQAGKPPPGGGQVAIWEMDGNQIKLADFTRVGSTAVGAPGNDWHLLGADDYDHDGKADLLWRTDSNALAIWQMDGTHVASAGFTRVGSAVVGAPGNDWQVFEHHYDLL
jgi:hypothetical protein